MDFLYDKEASSNNFSFDFSDRVKAGFRDSKQEKYPQKYKPITRAEDVEFVGERKVPKRKLRPQNKVKYLKTKTSRRVKSNSESMSLASKLGWGVSAILFLRLFFMTGGVYDYYHMDNVLKERANELHYLNQENEELVLDIDKIKTNSRYQKELAREHLGVIEKNEYLILFAKD